MTVVSGDLKLVSDNPAAVTEVLIRAPRNRLHGTGVVLSDTETIPVEAGVLTFTALPGPVLITPITSGGPMMGGSAGTTLEGDVPEGETATLKEVLEAAASYTPEQVTIFAQLRSQAEDAAVRAEGVAASVYWQDDRLSVMGVLGPSLRGPKGDTGDGTGDGTGGGSGDVLWSELNPILDGKAPADHQHSWGDVTGKPETYPPESHTHPSTDISDATATGRSVLTAESQAAARQAIGAGTSSLALGTTSSTAAAGDHTHTPASIGAAPASHTHSEYAEASRVTALEGNAPIIVSSMESSPLPGRIYYVTG